VIVCVRAPASPPFPAPCSSPLFLVFWPPQHEHATNFSAYKARFYGFKETQVLSKSPSLLYYSFDDDLVHFTVIDTETYFYCNGTATLCKEQQAEQLAWIEADLAAVDRSRTPWIIVLGHKQGW
jgi:acid phosphatase type 7